MLDGRGDCFKIEYYDKKSHRHHREVIIKNIYTIQLASKISGVGIHTIRAWEKRYGAVVPERNSSGRREYSEVDVERLVMLSELCVLGHSIGQIANYPTEELKILLEKIGKMTGPKAESAQRGGLDRALINIPNSLESLLMALKSYKLDIISHEIQKLKIILTPRELAVDILAPLLREVGMAVAQKQLSISQEQALSSLLKFHIGHSLFRHYDAKSKKADTIILFTPETEYHEFGIFMAGLLCSHYGIKFFYLGANLPFSSLMDAFQSVEATKMIMGLSTTMDGDNQLIEKYTEKLLKELPSAEQLIVFGGQENSSAMKSRKYTSFGDIKQLDQYLKNL